MNIDNLITDAKTYFPNLKVQYKDSSSFMKLLGYILFFNKRFMTSYTTTIGSTIYFPNEKFITSRPNSAITIFLHELVHVHDANRFNKFIYSLLYLFPITLLLVAIPLFFISWEIALVLAVLSLCPLPAYFRMYFERRAYMVSLYAIQKLSEKKNFNSHLDKSKDYFISEFKSSSYYFMWIFPNINKQFDDAVANIKANKHPYEDPIFKIIDDLINRIEII
jgi:hypothetical protein